MNKYFLSPSLVSRGHALKLSKLGVDVITGPPYEAVRSYPSKYKLIIPKFNLK